MFVLVPSTSAATVDSIKTASLASSKIYFMAKYNQIVAKGTVYGVDPSTGKELETLVSVLGGTKASDGTVSVDFSNLNYYTSEGTKTIIGAIEAIDAKVKAEMDKIAASKTLNENYEFSGQIKYVAAVPASEGKDAVPAHIALVDEAGSELSTIAVSDIIGNGVLKTSAYDAVTGILTLTFAQADGTTKAIEVDLKAMLDINDISIAEASKNYLEVALGTASVEGETQAVFGAKIVKVAEASDAKTGLVDAKDVKDYVDGKTTDLAVTAEGDAYVSASVKADVDNKHVIVATNVKDVTYTAGTHATYNVEGALATEAVPATISGEANSLVDGEQATTAIKSYVDFAVAEEALRSDAKVVSAIKALDKEPSTVFSSYDEKEDYGGVPSSNICINYEEKDGIVTISNIKEYHARVAYITTTSTPDNPQSNAYFDVSFGWSALVTGEDIIKLSNYVDDKSLEEKHRVDKKIGDTISSLDKPSATVDGSNVHVTYKEEDGIVTIESVSEDYATVTRGATTSTSVAPVADASLTVKAGDEAKLVKAADLKAVADYAVDKVTEEAHRVDKKITDTIDGLDVPETEVSESGEGAVKFKYSETDGKVAINQLSVTYAEHSANTVTTGLVTGTVLNDVLADMWETYVDA